MYFTEILRENSNDIKPINESFSYTIKNLIHFIKDSFEDKSEMISLQSNIDRMKKEFDSQYKITKDIDKALQKAVDKYATSQNRFTPIDFIELDKYFKLKDRIGSGNSVIDAYDRIPLYGFMYRSLYNQNFAARYGVMTIPYILNNRYVLFIQFDDNDIQRIYLVVSENMYDLESMTAIIPLEFTKYISKSSFRI